VRHLNNRKFCLECSPFGGHNTNKVDPAIKGKKNGKYADWSEDEKLIHRARVYRKALIRKAKLIEDAGNGCQECGYNKCYRALHFHHLDSTTKSFELNLPNLWSKSWESILKEYEKCKLLCSNCHAEISDLKSEHGIYRKIIKEKWGDSFL
jgi:hypothetical protein